MSSLYLHPLAYIVGLEGVALMQAFAGEHDRDFTHARLAEVRRLLDSPEIWGDGVELRPITTPDGYDGWASSYDDPDNGYFAMDEAALLPMIDRLPVGVAVDAACGTGRYAAHLVARGHQVHGFDTSPGMLALARPKVPEAHLDLADMATLPLADGSVDLVVNTLAMTHVEELGPVFAEAARVLRPGGHLVVSDVRGYYVGSDLTPVVEETPAGEVGYIRAWSHPTSSYLRAAIPVGFLVRDCREIEVGAAPPTEAAEPPIVPTPGEPPSIWELHTWVPEAAHMVHGRRRCLIVWDFELGG